MGYNIKPTPIHQEYVILEDGERQYDNEEFYGTTKIVEAKYVHSDFFPGNPLVEALPEPRTAAEIMFACQKDKRSFDYQRMIHMPLSKQIQHIISLRSLHYVLPMQAMLEICFYSSLVNSYAHRNFLQSRKDDVSITVSDSCITTSRKLLGNPADSAFGGFTMIGKSGCGKSTALNDLLANYPQVIIHRHEDGSTTVQLVYIVVNCASRSNFRALMQAIGLAIDVALGNNQPFYETELTTKRSDNLGITFLKLRNIIEKLSIGMIILDEFQNVKLDSSAENSMSSMLFIGNETKCVFGVVGTRYAKSRMFDSLDDSLKNHCRLGPEIPADNYCDKREFVGHLIDWLFRYQLFYPKVEPDDSIKEALYQCSKGIVDQLVSIFSYMNIDFILRSEKNKPVVDADFVKKTAELHFPTIQKLLKNMDKLTQKEEDQLRVKREEMEEEINHLLAEQMMIETEHTQEILLKQNPEQQDPLAIRDSAIEQISLVVGTKYNRETIEKKVLSVMNKLQKKEPAFTLEQVVQEAASLLLKGRSDARPGVKSRKDADNDTAGIIDLDAALGIQ